MPPRKARSRSTSRAPEGAEKKAPRSRRTSAKGSVANTPAKPQRPHDLPSVNDANQELFLPGCRAAPLKQQELNLDHGVKIHICRVRLPTPKGISGHLIRRLDTDAVSASSLYRVAFPTATADAEEEEMEWVAEHYDTISAGSRDETHRLTGTWVPLADAKELAQDYNLSQFIDDLINFQPGGNATPLKQTESFDPPTSATSTATPIRATKRQRTKSIDSSAVKPTVTVTQTIAADPSTGALEEKTQVDIEGEGLVGSDATVERAVADAKELVETLKEEGTLPSIEKINPRKRPASAVEDALVPYTASNGVLGRIFASRDGQRVITPGGRRLIALGGVLITGAAAAAAPYFFG